LGQADQPVPRFFFYDGKLSLSGLSVRRIEKGVDEEGGSCAHDPVLAPGTR
jgi:hypothetical protein